MFRKRIVQRSPDFIDPCLPSHVPAPPPGPGWVHEIKHDGYRVQVHRRGDRVRCFTRRGFDWTHRFPAIAASALALRADNFILAVACDPDGLAVFDRLRGGCRPEEVFCYAFDVMALDDEDLRPLPLAARKKRLARLLGRQRGGVRAAQHVEHEGGDVYRAACELGAEGIVSKRLDARYRSGRSPWWLKTKNPHAPAVSRLLTETW